MNDDIVEQLRDQRDEDGYCVVCGDGKWESHFPKCTLCEAADEIERLRALVGPDHESGPVQNMNDEVKRLRALITEWADAERAYFDTPLLRRGRARAALTRATLARIALRRAVGR